MVSLHIAHLFAQLYLIGLAYWFHLEDTTPHFRAAKRAKKKSPAGYKPTEHKNTQLNGEK